MKKVFRLVALAGAMVLAACSSDEITAPPKVVTPDMVNSYVNIRICTPGVGGTRAAGDGDGKYEYGEADENKVETYLLLFYDAQGNLVGTSEEGLDNETQYEDVHQNVAVIRKGTAKVTLTEGSQMPTQFLTVINPSDVIREKLYTSNLSVVNSILVGKGGVDDIEDTWDVEPGFLMSNSVYYSDANGTSLVMATSLGEGLLYSSEEAAEKALENGSSYINVYVERLAVKGNVQLGGTDIVEPITNVLDVDGNPYELTFNVLKYDVTATAPASYFVKNLRPYNEYSNTGFATWLNATNDYRSYWAQSCYSTDNETTSFPVVGDTKDYILDYKSTTDVENSGKDLGDNIYFAENTLRQRRFTKLTENPWTGTTAFLLNGKYTVTDAADKEVEKYAEDFYLSAENDYSTGELKKIYRIFNKSEAITKFAAIIKEHKIVATNENGVLDAEKLGIVHKATFFDAAGKKQENNPANRVTIQLVNEKGEVLTEPTGIYVYTGESTSDDGTVTDTWREATKDELQAINEKIEKEVVGTMMMYNAGRAFFYIPIKHYTGNWTNDDAKVNFPNVDKVITGNFGVVRNHVYKLTVNKITGLGIGVGPNPDIPEIPDPEPVQNYYINAQLNVLQWHVMGQTVDL